MYWEDLNKNNVENIQKFYCEYLENNKDKYSSQLEGFEEFMQNHITKCSRCGEWTWDEYLDGNDLCPVCKDDVEYNDSTYEEATIDSALEEIWIEGIGYGKR